MKIHFLRHATLILEYSGLNILVDPMFSQAAAKDAIPNTPNPRRNPLIPLPVDSYELQGLIAELDISLVTHLHSDHWDEAAQQMLPKSLKIFCQPEDNGKIREAGFSSVEAVANDTSWKNIEIMRTGGQHGRGEIGKLMAPVSGFVLKSKDAPSIYIAGDTVWCDEVESALRKSKPDVIILNAGAAQFLQGGLITMDRDDVARVMQEAPGAAVVVVHMEAINHCVLTRAQLRSFLDGEDIGRNVRIPKDGETLSF